MNYLGDSAALARKDLLLELRAKDTLPAMVLFVVATLVVFRFALPGDASDRVATGLLWVAILFTALLALTRAFVPEREQRARRARPGADRPQHDLDRKSVAVLGFLLAAEAGRPAGVRIFFDPLGGERGRRRPRRPRHLHRGRAPGRDGGRRAGRELLLPLLFLPLAIPIVVGGVGAGVTDEPLKYLAFLGLYDAVFAILAWASFEYVVTE